MVFLANTKLNKIEVLVSKALIDSNISHDKFFSINNSFKRISWYERRNQKDLSSESKILGYL